MKERPILFSAPMVNAILDGKKTQTRRILKFPENVRVETVYRWRPAPVAGYGVKGEYVPLNVNGGISTKAFHDHSIPCPHGKVGDQLWVRETWFHPHKESPSKHNLSYRADGDALHKWYPSIHMPRWASRIQLEITDIRVERLQDISDDDALEEGVDRTNTSIKGYARQRFQNLWQKINGVDSWDQNPWVWVIEFERIKP